MRTTIGNANLELTQGDITAQRVDCLVNAANRRLAGGGGVDGAIHRVAGPSVMAETDRLYPSGCPTGSAVITTAGELSARYVVHAVGPIWNGGQSGEADLLRSAYWKSLELVREGGCASVALPALSTGAYGYPMDLASRIALSAAGDFLREYDAPAIVRFVLFGEGAYGAFAAALEKLTVAWNKTS